MNNVKFTLNSIFGYTKLIYIYNNDSQILILAIRGSEKTLLFTIINKSLFII